MPSKSTVPTLLRVAAVQMKFAPTIEGNLATVERLLGEVRRKRADAALFPECAVTGYRYDFRRLTSSEVVAALARVGELAARFRINVLIGTPVFREGRLYNALVVFDRRGKVVHCYGKCHLTPSDREFFAPGNAVGLFAIDGIRATTVICHERRYPELVRLGVMAGAQIVFHPNAGMDAPAVSRKKRGGKDGIAARAFENAAYYVFANTVGSQGGGTWSAGDSKIVAPDERVLALADNEHETVIAANLDLAKATRSYAVRALEHPRFLASSWAAMVDAVVRQAANEWPKYDLP